MEKTLKLNSSKKKVLKKDLNKISLKLKEKKSIKKVSNKIENSSKNKVDLLKTKKQKNQVKKNKFLNRLNNHKKISFLFLVIIIISSIFYLNYLYKKDLSLMNLNSDDYLIVVADLNCKVCQIDHFINQVKINLIPNLVIEKVDINSKLGKEIILDLNLNYSPIYLFSSNLNQRDDWLNIQGAFVEVYFKKKLYYLLNQDMMPIKKLNSNLQIPESSIRYGNSSSDIKIVAFIDYENPYSAISFGNIELLNEFQNSYLGFEPSIPILFENFINLGKAEFILINSLDELNFPNSKILHKGAICAYKQDKWLDFNKILIHNRDLWLSYVHREEILISIASDLDLDVDEFSLCLNDIETLNVINNDLIFTKNLEIKTVPSFFINEFYLSGIQNYSVFETILDLEFGE